jgi:hypothetical protein
MHWHLVVEVISGVLSGDNLRISILRGLALGKFPWLTMRSKENE